MAVVPANVHIGNTDKVTFRVVEATKLVDSPFPVIRITSGDEPSESVALFLPDDPKSISRICDELIEALRDAKSWAEVRALGLDTLVALPK